ncbi:MAG TPA: glycosyltransferase [Candidatus Obscuribacterales bacterium]
MAKVILAGDKHLKNPCLPRYSRHTLIHPKKFPFGRFPLEKIWSPMESLASWQPISSNYQLIHSFNAIPYTKKPFFVTFELFLPYMMSSQRNSRMALIIEDFLKLQLSSDNCKKIIAISNWAKTRFINHLANWPLLSKVINKLEVIHPNFPVLAENPKNYTNGETLNLLFVGSHFARKGGIVALRLANKAHKMGIPIKINLISQMKYGSQVPTDFPDITRYEEDLKLLNLPNIVFHRRMPNKEVLELLSQSHFQIMATLQDTYGFSVVEGFTVATPAITTNLCALPELVHHGKNGYLLQLPLNKYRQWSNWADSSRIKTDEYWEILDSTYEDLADQALQLLGEFIERPDKSEHYEMLSAGALVQAQNVHDSKKINNLLDNFYSEAIGEVVKI